MQEVNGITYSNFQDITSKKQHQAHNNGQGIKTASLIQGNQGLIHSVSHSINNIL